MPWSGYTTVDVFTSVEQEYFAIRNAASLYDLTPMVKYRIAGADALRFLNRLMTRDLGKLKPGRVAYSVWCNDDGHLIDDGTVFCLGRARVPAVHRRAPARLAARISAIGFDVEIAEVTEEVAALALQGPTSCSVLQKAGLAGVERLKPFELGSFACPRPGAARLMVSRTGFTGDLGYELWMSPTEAERVWDALMEAGRTRGIRAVGSRALNIARIEAGFLLPNVDFIPAERTLRIGTERSPLELGLAWLVDFGKGHFTGPPRAPRRARRGPHRLLVGLDVEGTKPAHNALLYSERAARRQVGSVTSAAWSPTTKRNLALAMVDAPAFRRRERAVGRHLSQPRAGVGAAHGARAHRRAAVLRPAAPPRDAPGRLLSSAMIASQHKQNADRPWLDPSATPQIIIEGVSKSYGAFTAVDNVNLSIYKGEMFALVGASGCGKTTLLRMLAGFAEPSSGRILIDGVPMGGVPPYERPVNMMFQSYALFPHMTVERNVGYGISRDKLDRRRPQAAHPGGTRDGAARARGGTQAAPALRRPAPARGAGARADPPPQGAAAR